mmetsp:Transcript_30987/g.34275  ORF Transcript_30987/g.34275 Transcript_30987/m.34275 type:complete len:165 (-) Transcript_30987:145-639(-)
MDFKNFQQISESSDDNLPQHMKSEVSYDSDDEEETFAQECFNKSIFRRADDLDRSTSPLKFSRANPIGMDCDDDSSSCYLEEDDELHSAITPYPYSPSQEELEDRLHLASEMPRLAYLSDEDSLESIDYNCYFRKPFVESSKDSYSVIHTQQSHSKQIHVSSRK